MRLAIATFRRSSASGSPMTSASELPGPNCMRRPLQPC